MERQVKKANLATASHWLIAQYLDLQFHVILWPNQDAPQQLYAYEKMRAGFRRMGIRLHLVDAILYSLKLIAKRNDLSGMGARADASVVNGPANVVSARGMDRIIEGKLIILR